MGNAKEKAEMVARYNVKAAEYEHLTGAEADTRVSSEVAGYLFNLLASKHWSKEAAIKRLHKLIDIFDQTIHRIQ